MDQVLVGGPLLGKKRVADKSETGGYFEPLVTPDIQGQRFVLLPHQRFVTVVSHQTGHRLGTIVLAEQDGVAAPIIQSALVATFPTKACAMDQVLVADKCNRHVLLLGCRNGKLLEFDVSELVGSAPREQFRKVDNCLIKGPIYQTQRTIHLSKELPLVHRLAALSSSNGDDLLVHAIVGEESSELKRSSIVRFSLSPASSSIELETIDTLEAQPSEWKSLLDLKCVVNPASNKALVLVADGSTANVYCCNKPKVSFRMPKQLTSIAVSPNGKDLACGFASGEIHVMTNFFPLCEEYTEAKQQYEKQENADTSVTCSKPKHPSKELVSRKLHWHVHPVEALSYDDVPASSLIEPMLFSAGEESVLVTWQLANGVSKPSDTIPRVALDGLKTLTATSSSSTSSILVYGGDNSLQLFASHNSSRIWKVQGLGDPDEITTVNKGRVLCSGLQSAPGFLHWYDPQNLVVKETLQIAPFNRISRAHRKDKPLPVPTVPHCAMSFVSKDILTIDIVTTENKSIGKDGRTSTIRFWSPSSDASDYRLVASMSHPHGFKNEVSAVSIAPNGTYACTLSEDEGSFRLWSRVATGAPENIEHRAPEWICDFKVSVPAGLSTSASSPAAMDFSNDSSTLAIAFGSTVTLWNHSEATLLGNLRLPVEDEIRSLSFVRSSRLLDMLLTSSATGVCLHSPFGEDGPKNLGWAYLLPVSPSGRYEVVDVEYVEANNSVAVAVYDAETNTSSVVWIDAISGTVIDCGVNPISSRVKSLTAASSPPRSNWGNSATTNIVRPSIFALTEQREVLCIKPSEYGASGIASRVYDKNENIAANAPTIALAVNERKRTYSLLAGRETGESVEKKLALEPFGGKVGDNAPPSSRDLPSLDGVFLRSFVGRHLRNDMH